VVASRQSTSVLVGIAAAIWAAALLSACDSAPGPLEKSSAPVLSEFSFAPTVVDVAQTPPDQIVDDSVEVPFTVSATVVDADGDLGDVSFVISTPVESPEPLVTGRLAVVEGSKFVAEVTLKLPVAEAGNYPIRVFAVDGAGSVSNQAHGILRFGSSLPVGTPPVVVEVIAEPDTVTAGVTAEFVLGAVVFDADGVGNILRVELTTPNGQTRLMSFLEEVVPGESALFGAGFTLPLFVCPENFPNCLTPGVQTFSIQPFDRNGNVGDVVQKDIVVE
jgi:hypothetical protein